MTEFIVYTNKIIIFTWIVICYNPNIFNGWTKNIVCPLPFKAIGFQTYLWIQWHQWTLVFEQIFSIYICDIEWKIL